jgi:hypothetical protein
LTDTVRTRPRAPAGPSIENGLCSTFVLLSFYFRLFSGRPSMPHEKREKRSITYEKGEWRLIRSDQIKSMISEF